MSALAKAYAVRQQNTNKRDDPDSCNSLHLGSILPSGKRLLGWSAMRLKAHLDSSSQLGIRLSNSAHPREEGTSWREQTARGEPAPFRFGGDDSAIWPQELVLERGIPCRSRFADAAGLSEPATTLEGTAAARTRYPPEPALRRPGHSSFAEYSEQLFGPSLASARNRSGEPLPDHPNPG